MDTDGDTPEEELERLHLHFKRGDAVKTNHSGLKGLIGICVGKPVKGVGCTIEFGHPIGRRIVPEMHVEMHKKYVMPTDDEQKRANMDNITFMRSKEDERVEKLRSIANKNLKRVLESFKSLQPTPAPSYIGEFDPEFPGQINGIELD
eukprot:jgi/Bigna1/125994/aug1.1_g702